MWRRFITTVGVAATLSLACGAQTVDEVIAKFRPMAEWKS